VSNSQICNAIKCIYFKKQGMSFLQGLPESSHMDVNVVIHSTGYQLPSSYDESLAQTGFTINQVLP